MIEREKFYKLLDHKLENIETLMNDRLTELIRSNGGSINFYPNDDAPKCYAIDEVVSVQLDDKYLGGIKIQLGDGATHSFCGRGIREMAYFLVKCEDWLENK